MKNGNNKNVYHAARQKQIRQELTYYVIMREKMCKHVNKIP